MTTTRIRVNWTRVTSDLSGMFIGVSISAYADYWFTNEIKLPIFCCVFTISFLLINNLYYYYLHTRKFKDNKYLDIDTPPTNENSKKRNFDGLITKERRKWVKISIIIMLAIFSRIITSRWILPGTITLDYVLYEGFLLLNNTYQKLFPSNGIFMCLLSKKPITNSMGWSKSITIIVALFFDIIEILILMIVFVLSGSIIPFSILYEVNRYTKVLLNSGDKKLLLPYKVLEFFVYIIDNYTPHLCSSLAFICCSLAGSYWSTIA